MVKHLIKIGIAVSIILSFFVGAIYFQEYRSNTFTYITLIIFNILRIFTMEPDVPLMTLAPLTFGENAIYSPVLYYVYAVAVYLAPICTVGVLLVSFDYVKLIYKRILFKIGTLFAKRNLVIIGYNELAENLIENNNDLTKAIYVFGTENKNVESKLTLLNKKAKYCHVANYNDIFSEFNINTAVCFKKEVIIAICVSNFEDSCEIISNIEKYLQNNKNARKRKITILCNSTNVINADMLDAYSVNIFNDISDAEIYAKTFDTEEIRMNEFFESKADQTISDYSKNSIRNVVLGYGNFGKNLVYKLINQCVYNANGIVNIDIIDNNIEKEKNYLVNFFSLEYVEKIDDYHYRISNKNDHCDGVLNINFHNIDLYSNSFESKIKEINNDKYGKIDNFYLCISNNEKEIYALSYIKKTILTGDDFTGNIGIYIRKLDGSIIMDSDYDISENLKVSIKNIDSDLNIYNIDTISDTSGLEAAIHDHYLNEKIKNINNNFNSDSISFDEIISGYKNKKEKEYAEELWKKNSVIYRKTFYTLFQHKIIMKSIIEKNNWQNTIKKQIAEFLDIINDSKKVYNYVKNNFDSPLVQLFQIEHRRRCYIFALMGFSYGEKEDYFKLKHPRLLTYSKMIEKFPEDIHYSIIPVIRGGYY